MALKLKILHHSHSWRLRPHEHTSYLSLFFLVLVTAVALSLATATDYVQAGPGPFAGSVGLTGTMPGKPPTTAATITQPTDGQHFNGSPITVAGTCPENTLVEIFKNKIFAGSIPCDKNGKFSLKIDLLFGKNKLTAIVYDALNQAGPSSAPVTVFYDVLPPQGAPSSFLNFSGAQLLLDTDAIYRGTFPGQGLNVPISVIGGTPPFAINVDWGDSTNKVIPRGNNSVFNASHVYKKPGIFKITLQGSDSKGLVAYLQVAVIVNGQPAVVANTENTKPPSSSLWILWIILAVAATAVISFWLGEQREKRLLKRLNSAPAPNFGPMPQPQA